MKIRSLFLASALIVTAAGVALAQSTQTSPTERTGSKASEASDSAPSTSGGTMAKDNMKGSTTGSAVHDRQTKDKNVSPASQNAGEKPETGK